MLIILRSSWALFFGVAMVFLANGLQGSLIGVRASIEGYSPFVVGIIMTGYYAGFMLGALFIPERIQKVGHVRVFASLASIASIAILLHSLHFSIITWFLMRYTTGFCFVGMYCVAESWINDQSENESRGQALSVYMIISMGGNAIGQLFLNFADPSSATLFMLVSILISLSLVPILITVGKQPDFTVAKILSIKELYKASPLGVISAVAVNGCPKVKSRVSTATAPNGSTIPQVATVEAAPDGEVTSRFPVSSCLALQPASVNVQSRFQPLESVAQSAKSSASTVRYSVPVINGIMELLFG